MSQFSKFSLRFFAWPCSLEFLALRRHSHLPWVLLDCKIFLRVHYKTYKRPCSFAPKPLIYSFSEGEYSIAVRVDMALSTAHAIQLTTSREEVG